MSKGLTTQPSPTIEEDRQRICECGHTRTRHRYGGRNGEDGFVFYAACRECDCSHFEDE